MLFEPLFAPSGMIIMKPNSEDPLLFTSVLEEPFGARFKRYKTKYLPRKQELVYKRIAERLIPSNLESPQPQVEEKEQRIKKRKKQQKKLPRIASQAVYSCTEVTEFEKKS